MVRRIAPLLALLLVGAGCGSNDGGAATETKPNDVAPELTAEQRAFVEANKDKPFSNSRKK